MIVRHLTSLAALMSVGAAAGAELPRVWAWTAPASPIGSRTPIRPLVMVSITPASSPTAVADEICNKILQLGLAEGEVAITILGYGRGSLVHNPADALLGSGLPDTLARGVPWTANGVATMSAWTDAFIARYQQRQLAEGIPSPSRFHMDSELRLPTLCYLPDIGPCWGTAPLEVFHAMQSDPRWNSELLRMNPGNVPTLMTAAQAYAVGGSPAFDRTQPRDAQVNRAWSMWWDGFMREAVDGAFHAAFFSKVEAAWPSARCSEFAESMRLDGGIEPDGTTRGYIDFEWWNEGWMRSRWCGRASLQAPAFYVFGETFVDPALPFMDEQIRLHRANLDACLHSFGGVQPAEITPWVTLPGIALPFGESPATNLPYTNEEFLRIAALFRSRGISEFMLWPGTSATTWSAVGRAIDSAWSTDLTAAQVVAGVSDQPLASAARLAERTESTITAAASGIDVRLAFTSPPVSGCAGAGALWLAIESRASADSAWIAEVRANAASAWSTVASFVQAADVNDRRWIGPLDATSLVAGDGSFEIRLRTTSAKVALSIDLVQAVRVPAGGSDVNGDGAIDSLDLALLLGAWGTGGSAADIDRDGIVGSSDLSLLLNAWGACGGS